MINQMKIKTCCSCGYEYLIESMNGLLFYCVNCDPVAYIENVEPCLVREEQKILTTHGNEGGKI